MLEVAGCTDVVTRDNEQPPGLDIHEMGGCRMGRDPKTSMLNEWNQLHAVKNVFVTDGACMTSTGNQSPALLVMALLSLGRYWWILHLVKRTQSWRAPASLIASAHSFMSPSKLRLYRRP